MVKVVIHPRCTFGSVGMGASPSTYSLLAVCFSDNSSKHCALDYVCMKPVLTLTNQLCKFQQFLQRQSNVVKRKFDVHTKVSLFLLLFFIFIICKCNDALCLCGQHKGDAKTCLLY
jgi:hypothetical protein